MIYVHDKSDGALYLSTKSERRIVWQLGNRPWLIKSTDIQLTLKKHLNSETKTTSVLAIHISR